MPLRCFDLRFSTMSIPVATCLRYNERNDIPWMCKINNDKPHYVYIYMHVYIHINKWVWLKAGYAKKPRFIFNMLFRSLIFGIPVYSTRENHVVTTAFVFPNFKFAKLPVLIQSMLMQPSVCFFRLNRLLWMDEIPQHWWFKFLP